MTRSEVLQDLSSRFTEHIIELADRSPKRVYLEISPDALVEVASYIFSELGARFHIASGMDARKCLEILYHFSIESLNLLISLRVKLDKRDPKVNSLAHVIRGAEWIEREMYELLGIDFIGHPDLRRLLLSDAWPENVFPLRADYEEWDKNAIRDRGI